MRNIYMGALGVAALTASSVVSVYAAEDWGKYQVEDRRSGYTYAAKETRNIQDDDFENPAMIWVDDGSTLWNQVEGEAGKSCASCHNDASDSMKMAGAEYPKFSAKTGKMQNLEQRINQCREENMKAKPFKWESAQMLGMTTFVRHQSKGQPVHVKIDGPAAPFFEKGKAFYYERRGQLDMSCKNCHEDNAGNMARANLLSEGQSNGFPTYRLKWQKAGSLHRRFRGCNTNIRATPFGYGSDEYVNLELYVAWRGRGLPVETPSVRN
jgi:L-cysteine S-thiosulfotransferase